MMKSRKTPAGYKVQRISIYGPGEDEDTLENYIAYLEKLSAEIADVNGIGSTIELECYDNYPEYHLVYFAPLTEAEKEKRRKENKRRKELKAKEEAEKLERERKEFERLKKKFEN